MAGKQVDFALGGLQDSSGNPLSGGTVTFYTTGGLVAKDMFSDIALTTNIGSVVTLDAYGMAKVYSDGTVTLRAIVKDSAGNTIKDIDGLAYVEDVTSSTFTSLTLHNSSASNADGGRNSTLTATGLKADSTSHSLVSFDFEHDGSGNDTKGRLSINVNNGTALTEYLEISSDGSVAINGATTFTGNMNVTGSIGLTGTVTLIESEPTGEAINGNALLVLKDTGTNFIQFAASSGSSAEQGILFGDDDDDNGGISYTHGATPSLKMTVAAAEFARITGGKMGINTTSPRSKIDIVTASQAIATPDAAADEFVVENSGGNAGLTIGSSVTGSGNVYFADTGSSTIGSLSYAHSTDTLSLLAGGGSTPMASVSSTKFSSGILASSADGTAHIHTATAGTVSASTTYDDLVVENSGDGGISILTPNANIGALVFGRPSDNDAGILSYNHSNNNFKITTNGADRLYLNNGGFLGINEADPQGRIHITSDTPATTGVYSGTTSTAKLVIEDASDSSYIQFVNNASSTTANYINFNDDVEAVGQMSYTHGTNVMNFKAASTSLVTLDGANTRLGFNNSSPSVFAHFKASAATSPTFHASAKFAIEHTNSEAYLQFATSTSATTSHGILFGDGDDADIGGIIYSHSGNTLRLRADNSDTVTVGASLVGVNNSSPGTALDIISGSNSVTITGGHLAEGLVVRNSAASGGIGAGITIATGTSKISGLYLADSGDGDVGAVIYNHADDTLSFRAGATDLARFNVTSSTSLELRSSDRAMILNQCNGTGAISAAAAAMLFYDTSAATTARLKYYDGTTWRTITAT
jgi:hypothetical protein